jgi:hypothetical protein
VCFLLASIAGRHEMIFSALVQGGLDSFPEDPCRPEKLRASGHA